MHEKENSAFKLIGFNQMLPYFRAERLVCPPQSAGPDVAAIMDCCLAWGPVMKEPFSRGESPCSPSEKPSHAQAAECEAPEAEFRGHWNFAESAQKVYTMRPGVSSHGGQPMC